MNPNLHYHRELLDPSLAPFCERYLVRLRYWHDLGVRWLNKVEVTPLYIAELRIAGDHLHVKLSPLGGVSYEFFTSEHVQDNTLASPGHAHGIEFSYVCGSATRAKFNKQGKLIADSPLYSSALEPTGLPHDPTWTTLDCESPQTKNTHLITWASWQNQKFFEYCWHPSNDGNSLLTSTLAQAPGWANQMGMYSPYCWARFGNLTSFVSDYGLDVAPTLYTRGGTTSGAPQLEHGWLYWRRAAIVTSDVGKQYFVSSDNYGRFQIYPVKTYTGAVTDYIVVTPPYPSWVSVPSPNDFTRQFAQWLWRFNKDGTKCVTIAFHSADTPFQKYLNNSSFFCGIDPATSADIVPQIALTAAQEDTPGLVEFGISIKQNGDTDLDVVVTFELLRSTYFGVDQRFIFDAAYFMKDVENIGIAEDTLITAELVCKTPPGYFTAGPSANAWCTEGMDACRQLQADVVVNANDKDMVPDEQLRFHAFGPAWMQFPTLQGFRDGIPDTGFEIQQIPTTTGSRGYSPIGPSLYDPDSVAVPGRVFYGPLSIGSSFAFLYSLELTTLSAVYEVDDEVTGKFTLSAVAYGKEFYSYTGDLGYTLPPFAAANATVIVPSARVHQAVFNFVINTAPGDGFSVHPAGHWALNLGGFRNAALPLEADLDWISIVIGKNPDGTAKRQRYTHKELFNKAFAQDRDYSFYHTPFTGEVLGDFGSFRTAGFFVTFR